MTREERIALRATTPGPAGLQRLAAILGGEITATQVLSGGISASVHALSLREQGGRTRDFILKRYIPSDPIPPLEWERLGFAANNSSLAPEAVAFDPAGAWFGIPALVMSRLPGTTNYAVNDVQAWTHELARVLAAIHATPLPAALPASVAAPHPWLSWTPTPNLGPLLETVARAVLAFQPVAPGLPHVFSHRDFHPQNVLWEGDTATGVIDWASAGLAPRGLDIATCRLACAIFPGGDAPDAFLAYYRDLTANPLPHQPNWDLVAALECLEDGINWATAVRHLSPAITGQDILRVGQDFAATALARLQ